MTHHRAPLIGLIGRKRSGKDTFAEALVERGYRRVAFADKLREAALAADPFVVIEPDELGLVGFDFVPYAQQYRRLSHLVAVAGWERAKATRDVRRLLQRFGTGLREVQPDLWLRAAFSGVDPETPVVVTDVRFPNEADYIEAMGGSLVRIERPSRPDDGDTHVSETALDERSTSYRVRNEWDVAHLHDAARVIAADLERLADVRRAS